MIVSSSCSLARRPRGAPRAPLAARRARVCGLADGMEAAAEEGEGALQGDALLPKAVDKMQGGASMVEAPPLAEPVGEPDASLAPGGDEDADAAFALAALRRVRPEGQLQALNGLLAWWTFGWALPCWCSFFHKGPSKRRCRLSGGRR